MFRPRHRGRSAWTGLLAALALLVQGLVPAAAMPTAANGTFTIQICTHDGIKTIASPQDQAPAVAHDCCDHCVAAVVAALPQPMAALAVRYAAAEQLMAAGAVTPSARARAPPRPPSQGPPLNA